MPADHASTRVAVLDLGSNTTRLLIADVAAGSLTEVDRRTEFTGLGKGVDASGRLSEEAIERTVDVLAGYRAAIGEAEVDRTVALATSAVRDAANGAEFRSRLREQLGIDVESIPGEEEARLTFLGATSGRSADDGPLLVVDIGGGSTELVIGVAGQQPTFVVSTQAGSVRQTDRHLHSDPPTAAELEDLAEDVRATLAEAVPLALRGSVGAGVAVAGTATSLAAIDQALDPYDAQRVQGYELTFETAERLRERLASLPLAERREVRGLQAKRAPMIVAGAAILVEVMTVFDLDHITVSEADILHGAALDAAAGRR